MGTVLTREELEAANCWEESDRASRPEMTDFRRRLRYQQARWREENGYPIGSHPIAPRSDGVMRLVGSRLPLGYAKETGANFLTPAALEAATTRTSLKEPHQSFDHQRLWADLLSSTALSLNLFGDLASEIELANRAVHTWWPDTPGVAREVRFAHSPGRFDMDYLGNLSDLDVALILDLVDGKSGIVGVDINYHERIQRELPKPSRLQRYVEIAERSGVFRAGAIDAVNGTDLLVMWLRHLLVLSMLQHPSGAWTWGRLVVVHPAGRSDFSETCARYRDLLSETSTFTSMTLEDVLDSDALPAQVSSAVRRRYIPD